jgi:hypothetical protein
MNEERTGKCLRQVEHIHGHLWHRYSITVNQVMVATVKLYNLWLQLFCSSITRRVSLVEQELLTLPEHLRSPPVFSGVRVTWSLVLYVFCRSVFHLLFLCCLSFFDLRILISSLVSFSFSSLICISDLWQVGRFLDNTRTKGETLIYKTLHRKLKIEQHEPHKTLGVNWGAPCV